MSTAPERSLDKTVLLFFEGPERDKLFRGDRHIRRRIKPLVWKLARGHWKVGFQVSFEALVRGLTACGYTVQVNDRRTALEHPEHPVGVCGFPHILDDWDLPNPTILGPGLFDHPGQAPHLMDDPRFRRYVVRAQWMLDLFQPYYPDRCFIWFAGTDIERWPDARTHTKEFDFLVYDKVRWNREERERDLVRPILAALKRRGLRYTRLRYGAYRLPEYRRLLETSQAMLFLCEHENQGNACHEALASNVPVLAWDQGFWLDPILHRFSDKPVPASSVPWFSGECGDRFRNIDEFERVLDRFLSQLSKYRPRAFVESTLSLERSGEIYAREYFAQARRDRT